MTMSTDLDPRHCEGDWFNVVTRQSKCFGELDYLDVDLILWQEGERLMRARGTEV